MNTYSTLISAEQLLALLASQSPVAIIDSGFDLADTDAGERDWRAGHIPGSVYLHLNRDLSSPPGDGKRGRHPLPDRSVFAETLARCGITPATTVIAVDRQGGPYAARLWWLMRWIGHGAVAVLDGGVQAWSAAGGELTAEAASVCAALSYPANQPPLVATTDAATLAAQLGRVRLIDARAPERFRGDVEPLDAAAGHIPGALNRFFKDNLGADGRFKAADDLRAAFWPLIGPADAGGTVHQCGSGVTACHNLLAMEVAGLQGSVLYPGSWSEWSSDPTRPIAKG